MTPTGSSPTGSSSNTTSYNAFFRELLSQNEKENGSTPSQDTPSEMTTTTTTALSSSPHVVAEAAAPTLSRIRCTFCNKKQILLHSCRCNGSFCTRHCNPESHSCAALIEYRAAERQMLQDQLTCRKSSDNHSLVDRI
jgi:predicted nucleic acid binding AN1-type Zn finger protein